VGAFPVVGFRDRLSVVADVGPALVNVGGVVLFCHGTDRDGTDSSPSWRDWYPADRGFDLPSPVCRIVVIYASL